MTWIILYVIGGIISFFLFPWVIGKTDKEDVGPAFFFSFLFCWAWPTLWITLAFGEFMTFMIKLYEDNL